MASFRAAAFVAISLILLQVPLSLSWAEDGIDDSTSAFTARGKFSLTCSTLPYISLASSFDSRFSGRETKITPKAQHLPSPVDAGSRWAPFESIVHAQFSHF